MTATPLERLCAHRGVAVPAHGQLLDLAPILDLRPADVLAIAGAEIPAEYMPAEPDVTGLVESLIKYGLQISEAEAVRDYARSLPRTEITGGPASLAELETVTFGAVFRRLLLVRNLSRRAVAYATWSAESTVAMAMGNGRVPMPERLELMAATLCVRADDLEAMAARTTEGPPPRPSVQDRVPRLRAVGELVLAVAPLKIDQINAVVRFADDQWSMRREPTTP
ncbi:hypothetical protein GCM10010399_17210 [Dactylosporangium fulvum]|uniref:Uncharacterized protein n=1 Tax=Dactylosporangium fulvum TaxID=53359 RepID=A0ABY5W031_9ACTN|nr:hypothetical protein [Dactylosporangium fulvum]UWP82779.1 hypothetical protein Dfulv_00155 [Dactylosporangium fulvum]